MGNIFRALRSSFPDSLCTTEILLHGTQMENHLKSGNVQLQSGLQAREGGVSVGKRHIPPWRTSSESPGRRPLSLCSSRGLCSTVGLEQTEDHKMASLQLCFRLLGLVFLLFALQGELSSFFPSFFFMISSHLRPPFPYIFMLGG